MRSAKALLMDIANAVRDVQNFVDGMDEAAFSLLPENDPRTYRAIKNAFAEIGEAAKYLPAEMKLRHPDIEWKGFAALRDVLAHQYFRIEMPRLWPVIAEELPELQLAIAKELAGQTIIPIP